MLLFVISGLLLLITSWLSVSLLKPKSFLNGFIYFILLCFSQIVFITEILSIFTSLKVLQFLLLQLILFISILLFWSFKGRPFFKETPIKTLKLIYKNILKDKFLIVLAIGFVFFLIVSLFLALIMQIPNADAQVYHVARSFFWVINNSINHFETNQVRMLVFPINSEILYSWVILFTKNAFGLACFSYIGFILAISSLYGLMEKFSIRRKLWTIFIISSFASVIVQISATETDTIIAGLILSSLYLFKEGAHKKNLTNIFFASLGYALAIGTKTTAFFTIPASFIFMCYYSHKYLKKNFYKPILVFLGFSIINFLIFSAYNYIQNWLSFGNILGTVGTIETHKNHFGLKGLISNFIKNIFLIIDFTGFTWNEKIGEILIPIKNYLTAPLKVPDGLHTGDSSILNNTLLEPSMGAGILGLFLFLPCLLIGLIKPLFKKETYSKEHVLFSIMFIITMLTMSLSIAFMTYNVRFITSFMMISAPIIGYSYFYKRFKTLKIFIVIFAMFYFILVSTHLWSRPFFKIADAFFVKKETIAQINARGVWREYPKFIPTVDKLVSENIKMYSKDTKIAIFPASSFARVHLAKSILEGYNIDLKMFETLNINNIQTYDVLILSNDLIQKSYVIYRNEAKLNPNIYCRYIGQKGHTPVASECTINKEFLYNAGYRLDKVVYNYIFLKKVGVNK